MNKEIIKKELGSYPSQQVENFCNYIIKASKEKDRKTGQLKNPFLHKYSDDNFISVFKKIADTGLYIDGVHITLQSTGVSFDYVAYKNKMLLSYPETHLDVQIVYQNDKFNVEKNSGQVKYEHVITDPFNQKDINIIGAYCVIKNKRGEFITTLSRDELEKHRKVAKGDFIWAKWYKEMCLKTVLKKAIKYHFEDIYTEIEEEDNKQNDLEQSVDIELKWKQEIEAIEDIIELRNYYLKNKGRGKEFAKMITRKKELLSKELLSN